MAASSAPVEVHARELVPRAGERTVFGPGHVHRLGPVDRTISPLIPIAAAFVYRKTGPADPVPVDTLRRAVGHLLDWYPHLTGRLRTASDGDYELADLDSGAELVVATCPAPLDADDLPNDLIQPWNFSTTNPPVSVQHTTFPCGGVAVGVRTYHCITDMAGFVQLVEDLAELHRAVVAQMPPRLSRQPYIFSKGADQDDGKKPEDALAFEPSLFHLEDTAGEQTADAVAPGAPPPTTAGSPPALTRRIFRFSPSDLASLKAHAANPDGDGSAWATTFDAVCALLARSVYRARLEFYGAGLSDPDFLVPVDCRAAGRLPTPLPPRYFPNGVWANHKVLSRDVLGGDALWRVAEQIHGLTRGDFPDGEHLENTLLWLARQPDKNRIRHNFNLGNGGMMVSPWNRFDVFGTAVFGEDEPAAVGTPGNAVTLVDGLGYLLPADRRDGEVGSPMTVALVLAEPVWALLDGDEYVKRFCSDWAAKRWLQQAGPAMIRMGRCK